MSLALCISNTQVNQAMIYIDYYTHQPLVSSRMLHLWLHKFVYHHTYTRCVVGYRLHVYICVWMVTVVWFWLMQIYSCVSHLLFNTATCYFLSSVAGILEFHSDPSCIYFYALNCNNIYGSLTTFNYKLIKFITRRIKINIWMWISPLCVF